MMTSAIGNTASVVGLARPYPHGMEVLYITVNVTELDQTRHFQACSSAACDLLCLFKKSENRQPGTPVECQQPKIHRLVFCAKFVIDSSISKEAVIKFSRVASISSR